MNEKESMIEDFRRDLQLVGRHLTQLGFRYVPELDAVSPTKVALLYAGKHVAFIFTLAFRTQVVDASVVRCVDGKLHPGGDEGYSSDLVSYLITHYDFRGQLRPMPELSLSASSTARDVSALVGLLLLPCSTKLIADKPGSLPKQ